MCLNGPLSIAILDYYVRVDWTDIPALSEARNTCQDVTISYYITAEVLGEIPTGGKFWTATLHRSIPKHDRISVQSHLGMVCNTCASRCCVPCVSFETEPEFDNLHLFQIPDTFWSSFVLHVCFILFNRSNRSEQEIEWIPWINLKS